VKNGFILSAIGGGSLGMILINIAEPATLIFDYPYYFASGAGAGAVVGIPIAVGVTTPKCP
jgi:hypothetical protein